MGAQSIDYVNNKKQFQLHTLITEQSHPATSNLSETAKLDPILATKMLLTVDHDINRKIASLKNDKSTSANINQAVMAVKNSLLTGNRVYIYGTGSTGRLAKQIENIWYTFWQKTKSRPDWPEIAKRLKDIPNLDNIQNLVIGEITGGDRALIKSLEGFEDLQLIGKLQLEDNHINASDVVFAVTEGGETSAVIGTILAASKLPLTQKNNLYFVYNNPNKLLTPFDRSREILTNSKITKINFTTGNQAITGSTRMQATTSQTFLISTIIEQALAEVLHNKLSNSEFHKLGFNGNINIATRLNQFSQLQKDVEKQSPAITDVANLEYQTYRAGNHAIYFGSQLLTTLFIDVTERAPTFNLSPLDAKGAQPLSWVTVYTEASNNNDGWYKLLGRDFRGLDKKRYNPTFESNITDPYLKVTAIKSLDKAGYDQKYLYDLSVDNLKSNVIKPNDIGIAYLFVDEANAILFAACKYIEDNKKRDRVAVIPLVIVSVFEALQTRSANFAVADAILQKKTLSEYVNKL